MADFMCFRVMSGSSGTHDDISKLYRVLGIQPPAPGGVQCLTFEYLHFEFERLLTFTPDC